MADETQKTQQNQSPKHTQENVGSPLELCVVIRHSRRGRPSNASGIHEVAYFAWNCSLLPEEDCRRAIAKYVDNMRAAGGAEADEADMQALTNDLYTLVEHKKKHYPTIRKLVVSAELYNECTTKEIMSDAAQYPQIMMQW